jgi:hypothetical protein
LFKGVFNPMVTVFGNTGKIDFEGNRRVIERLVEAGVDGPMDTAGDNLSDYYQILIKGGVHNFNVWEQRCI